MTSTADLHTRPAAEAIPELLEVYGGRLYAVARRLSKSDADAQDLVQETFLRAMQKWDQFEGRSDPGTWLHTILVRLASRGWRDAKRRQGAAPTMPFGDRVLDLPDRGEGPLESNIRAEASEAVERAIADLPPEYRLPVVLREIAERSHAEVAEILGLKEATVRVRVHRGRLALREKLLEALPTRVAPPATASKRLCLDLLAAKQAALDNGTEFVFEGGPLCERCQAVFRDLELTHDACKEAPAIEALPEPIRARLEADLRATRGRSNRT